MKFVIFDLDGTLLDTLQDIAENTNRVLRRAGLRELPIDTIRGYVGRGARELIRRSIEGTAAKLDEVLADFMRSYQERLIVHTQVYPGVIEGLSKMAAARKAIASNKPEAMSVDLVRRLGLSPFFLRVAGGDTYSKKKPDPTPVLELMKEFGADASSTMIVGDSDIDVETARNAGIRSCAVTYGYTPRERLSGADWIVDRFEDVVKIVNG